MPKEFSRSRRVGGQIQRELAQLIRAEIKDPRVGIVSISGVEVSRDMAHAKVFITTLALEDDGEESVRILNGAAGFLRGVLGRTLRMRSTPNLIFSYDRTIESGMRMSSLIDEALASDDEKSNKD